MKFLSAIAVMTDYAQLSFKDLSAAIVPSSADVAESEVGSVAFIVNLIDAIDQSVKVAGIHLVEVITKSLSRHSGIVIVERSGNVTGFAFDVIVTHFEISKFTDGGRVFE